MTAIYRFIVALIGALANGAAWCFATVAANPAIVVFVAFALWVGLACLREIRHPGGPTRHAGAARGAGRAASPRPTARGRRR
jgi:hypothetical protein